MHHPELAAELAEVHPGVALKQMREKGGFGIRQVARAVGCSPSTLLRIERQTIKHPDPTLVWDIAEAIGRLRAEAETAA
jgi:transcriptional regulator with XRE-family HTH domain